MELTLEQRDDSTIQVICDGQPSHDFSLQPLLITPVQEKTTLINDPITYGQKIYACLFPADTPAHSALAEKPRRILLVLDDSALDAIPWEYVYGPFGVSDATDPAYIENFLVLECHIVRGLPEDQRIPPPQIDTGLHVIAVPSDPLDTSITPLGIEAEWHRLCDVMGDVSYQLTLERARPATLERVRQLIANRPGRVLHFMGHGGQWPDGALLCFEKENGALDLVKAQDFVKRVSAGIFLVTLNACVSAHPGPTVFSNLAAALAKQKMPYALGMRLSILDNDARLFSCVFYSELASGSPVEEALYQARLTLARDGNLWAVGVPVLYTALSQPAPGFTCSEGSLQIKDVLNTIHLEINTLTPVDGTFQGRITDLQQLGSYLTGDARPRLTTIHAGGGQGKTSLARKAVERFAFAWPGGVWGTSFENLPARATVAGDLARFLGIATQEILDPQELERQVLARLAQQRRTLIVLDNAEMLIDAVEAKDATALDVIDWLKRLPSSRVSLLATSRTLFGWPGEQALELGGLSPQEGAALFIECAPQRTNDILPSLARELSQKLDGHPLSLRLLAGAFNDDVMTLPALIAAYEERLSAAQDKYQHLDHRHRSLYACIETSVRTLNEDLQRLLSALWIFHSPFLAQTAVAIFDPDIKESEQQSSAIRRHLRTLWRRGLLTFSTILTRDGKIEFYYLLPTTRSYVEHDMPQQYEREELLARFGAECYAIVDYVYGELKRSSFAVVLARQTRDDLERGEAYVNEEARARYLCYLGWILYRLGSSQIGLQLLERAAVIVPEAEVSLKLTILNNMAGVYHGTGRSQEALQLYEEALPLMREAGDRAREASTLNNMAGVYHGIGRSQEALQLYEEALPLMREVGNREGEASTLNNIAEAYRVIGRLQEALRLHEEALPLRREVGDRAGEATTLNNLALVYSMMRRPQEALQLYEEALPLRREVGDRAGEATTLHNMAGVYDSLGRSREALQLYEEALPLTRGVGDRGGEAAILNGIAYLYKNLQRYKESQTAFEQSIELSRQVGNPAYEAAGLVGLALLLYQHLDRIDDAKAQMKQAIALLQTTGLPQDAAGHTLEQLQQYLEEMQPEATSGEGSEPSTLPAEVIQQIVTNTIAVMTVAQEKRDEWYEIVKGNLERAQAHKEEVGNEIAFFEAVLALMDGRVVALPEGQPYADAVKAIREGIGRAGGEPQR